MTVDLELIHESGGRFRCSRGTDHALATGSFEDGERVLAKMSRLRSGRQNRWLHAMVHAAWENQTAGPPFEDSEKLRKHLLIAANHCDVQVFAPGAITPAVSQWLRANFPGLQFTADRTSIYGRIAKSISYKACDHDTMCAVADKVIDVICDQIVPGTARADWEPYKPIRGGTPDAVSRQGDSPAHRPASSDHGGGPTHARAPQDVRNLTHCAGVNEPAVALPSHGHHRGAQHE